MNRDVYFPTASPEDSLRYSSRIARGSIPVLVFLLLSGCFDGKKNSSDPNEFLKLSEDQKRLPENALMAMEVADGLGVELFASEPMVTNPTNISVDDHGRVWVCEAYNYDVSPEKVDSLGDRIVVLEDTDHDGKADKRTVFYQGKDITTPLGIVVLGSRVYVTRSPNILVFTDLDGDLVADKKDTLLTNMGRKGDHSAHALFPGPDGKFYFSTGNNAGEIHAKDGQPLRDKAGMAINQRGNPYLGGMVLRFEEGDQTMEVLGHNFRNNYEPCIDSYGNIWQSDNDDDGNASCRLNFVMPFGNYGYLDEFTRASWTTNRINIEDDVPSRHWHQNDPGVVPNVLITGAGSPAGMTAYEGESFPKVFRGAVLHAEPYYNVVRAYLPKKEGAGFSASIKNILKSADQWFRPVDVTVAGDGSIFIADWYDPILGGGAAGDADRGRIYRVAPKPMHYSVPAQNYNSAKGAIAALQSPNLETRYLGRKALVEQGENSRAPLLGLWDGANPDYKVRAMWILAEMNSSEAFLNEALRDPDPNIRVAAVRSVLQTKDEIVPYLSLVVGDEDAHVRREVATALRNCHTKECASLWSALAQQHDGEDRWYLEALGIGADLHSDLFFGEWLSDITPDLASKSHRDIIWRSRSTRALPLLTEIIKNAADTSTSLTYFRAFDFHRDVSENKYLMSLLDVAGENSGEITVLALQQMDGSRVIRTPKLQEALQQALSQTQGTITFVDLVRKYNIVEQKDALVNLARKEDGSDVGIAAIDLLLKFNALDEIKRALSGNDSLAARLLHSMNGKSNKELLDVVGDVARDETRSISLRQEAVHTLGSSWGGEEKLLTLVREKSFDRVLEPVAASVLFNVYRRAIQLEAEKYLPRPTIQGTPVPTIKELLASSGSKENGAMTFTKNCAMCHRIDGEGVKFGPELTGIGSKMSSEGLYRAVLFPSDGISHGYESTLITMSDDQQLMGIVASETKSEVVLLMPGGTSTTIEKSSIKERAIDTNSLMPALVGSMDKQELVDLVTFLSELKAK